MSIQRANYLFKTGKFDEALTEYQNIEKSNPLYKQAQFNISLILKQRGQNNNISALSTNKIAHKTIDAIRHPLVSVIMPVFNVAPYLDASILSVLNQSYKSIELIIVNDASTDNGLNIIRMYEKQDERIKVINLEFNTLGGAGIPSNIGVNHASGEYIAYADSDDILSPYAIEKMVELAIQENVEIVVADFCNFDNESRSVETAYDKSRWLKLPLHKAFTPREYPSIFTLSPVPWRKLYRRDFLNSKNIRFPEGDYFYEDNPLNWFVLTSASRVAMLDYVVAYHRMAREGQTMGANSFKLSAQFCHLNSVKYHLQKMTDVPSSYWKELVDFSYRANWVVDKQDDEKIKKLIKKRYAQTATEIAELSSISEQEIKAIRPSFYQRCKEYHASYSNKDLAIVVPVFNCADLFPELMKSIIQIPLETEIFLIDDGSDDGSRELCEQYAHKHANVFCITQANKGAGVARNAVIPLLSAKYTYFVDADDIIDPIALKEAVNYANTHNNDLTLFKYKIHFYDKNTYRDMWNADQELWEKLKKANNNHEKKSLASQLINYPWNRIIKTSLLHDENIFFGKTVVHNDIPYHWHSIISAHNIGIFDKAVCSHRKFETRQQITNIGDYRRLMVLEAYRYTHELIKRYPNDYPRLFKNWQKFITELLVWAKDRIPVDKQEYYQTRHNQIIEELKGIQ